MKSKVVLNKIIKSNNEIIYKYKVYGQMKKYLKKDIFKISYGFNIESIPNSILVIPFVANILPLCWTFDSSLFIHEIDSVFYKSLDYIKNEYRNMLPQINFFGNLICKKIVENECAESNKKMQMFSGGVDSLSTYVNHKDEDIEFFYLWGSDISYNNEEGFNKVKEFVDDIALKEKRTVNYAKSNFRDIILYDNINEILIPLISDNYWHGIQHGIALLGHAAIVAYKIKATTIYIPSTYPASYHQICASSPNIDNNFKFMNTRVIHDGYEDTRLDKVGNIVKHNRKSKNKLKMRVCWQSTKGDNCSMCEKCTRTMIELLAYGENPKDYNFRYDDEVKEHMKELILNSNWGGEFVEGFYLDVAKYLKENKIKNKELDYLLKKYEKQLK